MLPDGRNTFNPLMYLYVTSLHSMYFEYSVPLIFHTTTTTTYTTTTTTLNEDHRLFRLLSNAEVFCVNVSTNAGECVSET